MRLKFLPSFVKRKGRITKKQLTSLNHLRNYSVSNIEDVIALETNFQALPATVDETDELEIKYVGAA